MKRLNGVPSCGDKLVGIMEQGSKTRARRFMDVPPSLSGNCREAQS